MTRFAFASLLAALTAFTAMQFDPPPLGAQEKGKGKAKAKAKAKDTTPPPPDGVTDDLSRVLPVFDPGSHTQPISAMGFTKDKTKLVTVGQDFTVQVWNAATGERLDLLRLPGYGREKGYDPGRWDIAAVSPDGTRVAIGGQPKFLRDTDGKLNHICRLLLVDVPNRRVMQVGVQGKQGDGQVRALTFSPDGDMLAVAFDKAGGDRLNLYLVGGLTARIAKATAELKTDDCQYVKTPFIDRPSTLAFSPDGKQLLVSSEDHRVSLWDVPVTVAPVPTLAKEITVEGNTHSLDWSPDGKQFARTVDAGQQSGLRAIEVWNADGTKAKTWKADDLNSLFVTRAGKLFTVKYLDAKTLYVVANGPAAKGDGGASLAATIDVATGNDKRVAAVSDGMLKTTVGAASADGRLVAVTISGNTEVLIASPSGGAPVRCGVQSQLPHHVGWSKDPAQPGFAWTDEPHDRQDASTAEILRFGFDLTKVEPVGAIRNADYAPSLRAVGDWTLEFITRKAVKEDDTRNAQLKQGGKLVNSFGIPKGIGHTLIPNGDKAPHIAFAAHLENQGDRASIHTADGPRTVRLLPQLTRIRSMSASPDGRFLICTTGSPRIVVYRTDGSPYPFFSFAQLNGEWVLWTPEGYYAASPGGEKLFGWAITNGPNELVTFHPAEKYAKHYRRPDVIKLAIEKGSVKEALELLKTAAPPIESILAPGAKLTLVEQRGATVTVTATASTGVATKPVAAMRVLLDGRPLPEGKGVWTPVADKPAEVTFTFDIPAGQHELKVLARTDDGASVSEPLLVKGPKSPGNQPTLHRVCVGINDYEGTGLATLGVAVKDAQDLFAALATHCVGPENRFGAAKGELILNKDATRDGVLKALASVRKTARPGDLVVIYFAGHGVKQNEAFYLVTREGNVAKDLKGFSVSGDDLRKALAEVECPVLMILDACHSAAAVRSFRPATDDLTRTLTDDAVGVTVMSAAMAHESAGATATNGHFTAGLLKGLRAEAGVPFDPYERQLYVHHLYSVAFSEVRQATNGKQNPFLNLPWTVPPMALRDVPARPQ